MELFEEMQIELRATQYWMKYLFLAMATGEKITSNDIDELLLDLKNRSTFDGDTDLSPAEWDERHLEYFPIYERIGLAIARSLKEVGK
ncbi:hypothetical protein BLM14_07345 [Phyllobacterium zundukense]|uniref:hypothetical protein n=1 Tax=Phyllobacterium zundukense TaxID=1867719 RepID=UPI000C1BD628|nr:hypothetical protein [Phyllobacterium zundukense]ATU91464.1 hypothetical protein BLM14_07345 [Phyllobacterium zundukense]